MIKISDKTRMFLEAWFPKYEEYDINTLLSKIDDLIILKGMINQDYLNDVGIAAQRAYDDIFYNN